MDCMPARALHCRVTRGPHPIVRTGPWTMRRRRQASPRRSLCAGRRAPARSGSSQNTASSLGTCSGTPPWRSWLCDWYPCLAVHQAQPGHLRRHHQMECLVATANDHACSVMQQQDTYISASANNTGHGIRSPMHVPPACARLRLVAQHGHKQLHLGQQHRAWDEISCLRRLHARACDRWRQRVHMRLHFS